jgi:mono/diheme cytochrome c family protein
VPQTYIARDRIAALDEVLHRKEGRPEVLYNRFCVNCHGDGSFGKWDPFFQRFGPAVRGQGLRSVADRAYLRTAIEQGRPGTPMPAWGKSGGGLTAAQIDALVGYLASGGRAARRQPAGQSTGGDPHRGGELFTQLCAGCHGDNRLAPSLANPVFQKTAGDSFILRTIRGGRPDTAMPAFQRDGADGLTDDEVQHLLAYLRSLGKK